MRDETDLRKMLGLAGLTMMLAVVIYAAYYRFSHPDLTETRLVLHCWPLVFPFFGGGAVVKLFLLDKERK